MNGLFVKCESCDSGETHEPGPIIRGMQSDVIGICETCKGEGYVPARDPSVVKPDDKLDHEEWLRRRKALDDFFSALELRGGQTADGEFCESRECGGCPWSEEAQVGSLPCAAYLGWLLSLTPPMPDELRDAVRLLEDIDVDNNAPSVRQAEAREIVITALSQALRKAATLEHALDKMTRRNNVLFADLKALGEREPYVEVAELRERVESFADSLDKDQPLRDGGFIAMKLRDILRWKEKLREAGLKGAAAGMSIREEVQAFAIDLRDAGFDVAVNPPGGPRGSGFLHVARGVAELEGEVVRLKGELADVRKQMRTWVEDHNPELGGL